MGQAPLAGIAQYLPYPGAVLSALHALVQGSSWQSCKAGAVLLLSYWW